MALNLKLKNTQNRNNYTPENGVLEFIISASFLLFTICNFAAKLVEFYKNT